MKMIIVLYILRVMMDGTMSEERIVEPDIETCREHMMQMEYTFQPGLTYMDCEEFSGKVGQ